MRASEMLEEARALLDDPEGEFWSDTKLLRQYAICLICCWGSLFVGATSQPRLNTAQYLLKVYMINNHLEL